MGGRGKLSQWDKGNWKEKSTQREVDFSQTKTMKGGTGEKGDEITERVGGKGDGQRSSYEAHH